MTQPPEILRRVLAIDPSSVGFGFAVLEEPTRLVDWGVAEVSSTSPKAFLIRIEALVDRYCPSLMILEEVGNSRTRKRTASRIAAVTRYAASRRIVTILVSRNQVRRAFGTSATKMQIAVAISQIFPELAPRLPRERKLWTSEDERMNIFDAVSFALTALAGGHDAERQAA